MILFCFVFSLLLGESALLLFSYHIGVEREREREGEIERDR